MLNPKLAPERETLIIPTDRNIIEVQHAYQSLDNLSYLFQKGDSVLFTNQGLKPSAEILNRNANSFEVNYDLMKRKHINKDNFPGIIRTTLKI